jgi:hypothetical protein
MKVMEDEIFKKFFVLGWDCAMRRNAKFSDQSTLIGDRRIFLIYWRSLFLGVLIKTQHFAG